MHFSAARNGFAQPSEITFEHTENSGLFSVQASAARTAGSHTSGAPP